MIKGKHTIILESLNHNYPPFIASEDGFMVGGVVRGVIKRTVK
jgi:SOS-response transcriptional repressor LexA